MAVSTSIRFGGIPIWKTIPSDSRSRTPSSPVGAPNRSSAAWTRLAFSGDARTQTSRSFVKRGRPWTASA